MGWALTVLCIAVLACACVCASPAAAAEAVPLSIRKGEQISVPEGSPLRKRLVVAAVGSQQAAHAVPVPAIVEADPARTHNVLPPLGGRLLALKVGLGTRVKRGDVLAEIASPDLAQAHADAEKARDALELARRALERTRGVVDAGANSAKDLEAAQSLLNQAQAEDRRANARLQTLQGAGEVDPHGRSLLVRAPSAGIVTALNLAAGSFINDLTAPLLTIANLDSVWVTAQVPEHLLGGIGLGQPVSVTVSAYPGQTWRGKVSLISPLLEADTRRVKVRIAFANPDEKLKPNMFALAAFALPQAAKVTVPSSALLMNNDSTTVLLEISPWVFVRRTVELGSEDGEVVRIQAGLKAGDRVLTRGGVLLND